MDGKGMGLQTLKTPALSRQQTPGCWMPPDDHIVSEATKHAGPGLTRGVGSDFCVEGSWVSQYCLDKMTGDGGKSDSVIIFCLSQKNEETMGLLYAVMAIEVERQDVSRRFLLLWDLLHKPDIPWAWILWTYMLVFSWIKESYQWRQQKDLEILERLKWMAKYHSFPWFPWFPYGPMVPGFFPASLCRVWQWHTMPPRIDELSNWKPASWDQSTHPRNRASTRDSCHAPKPQYLIELCIARDRPWRWKSCAEWTSFGQNSEMCTDIVSFLHVSYCRWHGRSQGIDHAKFWCI